MIRKRRRGRRLKPLPDRLRELVGTPAGSCRWRVRTANARGGGRPGCSVLATDRSLLGAAGRYPPVSPGSEKNRGQTVVLARETDTPRFCSPLGGEGLRESSWTWVQICTDPTSRTRPIWSRDRNLPPGGPPHSPRAVMHPARATRPAWELPEIPAIGISSGA